MSIIVNNSQLTEDVISVLNELIDMDINAASAFRLTRIIKELSSIIEDKIKMEKKILEKWVSRDDEGNVLPALDDAGNVIEGAVNISDVDSFTRDMSSLMEEENEIPFDKVRFEDLGLKTAKIKNLMKIEFLFD